MARHLWTLERDNSAIIPEMGVGRLTYHIINHKNDDCDHKIGFDMSGTFETEAYIAKVDEELGLVFGYAIVCKEGGVPYFDVQGDHIPEDAMLKAASDFMQSARTAKEMHVGDAKGTVVFAWPMTQDVAKSLGMMVEKTGLLIAMKPDDPSVLAKFKTGEYTGFSIGGRRVVDEEVA